jgi:hypothetical protein
MTKVIGGMSWVVNQKKFFLAEFSIVSNE